MVQSLRLNQPELAVTHYQDLVHNYTIEIEHVPKLDRRWYPGAQTLSTQHAGGDCRTASVAVRTAAKSAGVELGSASASGRGGHGFWSQTFVRLFLRPVDFCLIPSSRGIYLFDQSLISKTCCCCTLKFLSYANFSGDLLQLNFVTSG